MIDPDFMPYGMVSGGRTAEHWIDNIPITGLYKKFNTTLGTRDTPILTLNCMTPEMEDRAWRLKIPATPECFGDNSNIFTTRFAEDGGEIALSFTESLSTFQGHPIVRVNAKSIGKPLNAEVLKDVLAAMFSTGGQQVSEWHWDGNEARNVFGGKVPKMLVHAPGEQQIVNALRDMGAKDRYLGDCLMVPSVMDFDNLPESMIGGARTPARPFRVTNPSPAANDPCFDLRMMA